MQDSVIQPSQPSTSQNVPQVWLIDCGVSVTNHIIVDMSNLSLATLVHLIRLSKLLIVKVCKYQTLVNLLLKQQLNQLI